MPANKNALIRYKTIDNCLRNRYRRWTIDDLVDACCDALYDMEGISKGVSLRTVQGDLQMMRSDKLGYYAPIEVYDNKYYRYSDPDYSISNMPMSQNDYLLMREAVDMLRQLQDFDQFAEVADVVSRLQDKLAISLKNRKPVIHFDSVPSLKGLKFLNPLYSHIVHQQVLHVTYQSYRAEKPQVLTVCPYLLKEFRNRWFLFASKHEDLSLVTLALDRIISFDVAKDIPFRENPDFDTEHFFDDVIGVTKSIGDKPHVVSFRASPSTCKYITTKPIHSSQQLVKENADGSCEFKIEVVINPEMYSVFQSYGSGIRILSPQKAVAYMKKELAKLDDLY
jgi:predicted DNA-binding transcriptional regulator YafY